MDLSDYVDVPTRFAALLAKWPELRIKEHRPEIVTIGDKTFISVTMQAWRTPDDPIACQATCFEPFPGKNSFTREPSDRAEAREGLDGFRWSEASPEGPWPCRRMSFKQGRL